MKTRLLLFLTGVFVMCLTSQISAQSDDDGDESMLSELSTGALKFRSLGPGLTSGRISDFAMHPEHDKIYYIATSSGGVWKTVNAGNTYEPIFDSQGSYSIGVVTLDPSNPNTVWVGTGENNNQRSVAYGDGVYKSKDGGKTWKHVGLKESEHIGTIWVHPDSSDVVYVAAIGPLWSEGGDRGLYKTIDGGETWRCVLSVDEHTGVNEFVVDPRDPKVMYASTFQRRRHVFTYLGGGPGSGLHKSTDGGETWTKIQKGLPGGDLGRIGLTISPANPEYLYAIVEAANGGGFYRSTDRGASWQKRGGYVTSGNYYQEIIADPVDPHKVYAMDTWMKVSTDGGKTFRNVGEDTKHVDNHCIWIDPEDTDHLLVGCDGGIYETWDAGVHWDFRTNLPVVQFYKVAVDNAEPFYNIYGGTQDNFSLGGPSRTISANGIPNEDWFITQGGDGFESQVDHFNTDIVYAQLQYGVIIRYDKRSGERVGIKPQAREGENSYRWNWDAPLIASPHAAGRVYFAANKVFRSDDYGNSWSVISDDLTRQINRNELEVMGRIWEVDAVRKNLSTSPYGTIVAMSESTLNQDLLFVGTDDGLIQITNDGGGSWSTIESVAGVPEKTYVNAVEASVHDENVVYACFNNHKNGDFKPYVYKSTDKGQTWTSISSDLPERGSAYTIAEDHVDPNLLFVGTEFGVYFSNDGGAAWHKLGSGVPTVAVRDIAIQRRDEDVVLGTFGRGFFVLDDYSPLRSLSEDNLQADAAIMPIRDSWLYEQSMPLGLRGKSFQGDSYYQGDNLGSAALITYYLKEDTKSLKSEREKAQKEARKNDEVASYPSYDDLVAEATEEPAGLWFTIRNSDGDIVRRISRKPSKGIHRFEWDLRTNPKNPVSLGSSSFYNPFAGKSEGSLVAPGVYTVEMGLWNDGVYTKMVDPVSFNVVPLNNNVMPAQDRDALVAFKSQVSQLSGAVQGTQRAIGQIENEIRHVRKAITMVEQETQPIINEVLRIESELRDIKKGLNGDRIASRLDIDTPPSVSDRVGYVAWTQKYSTSEPTATNKMNIEIAEKEFKPLLQRVRTIIENDMVSLREMLIDANAPYTPGALPVLTDY